MSKQRTRKFVTKILRKTCSKLLKITSDPENNFTKNKYTKLQKISAQTNSFFEKKVKKCKFGIINSSITWCRHDRYAN